jgi:hypothetical protein
MALIGDGFTDYVKKQIDIRQQALGEYDTRQLKNTKAFMTRTPWIRMVSSVDLEPGDPNFPGKSVLSTLQSSDSFTGVNLSGDNLAKNFILFNGVSNQTGSIESLYSGITNLQSINFGGAYGFGSGYDIQNERGFVPMPGITNVSFQYKNDGALAMATVQIKAFSRSQFQLIDVLFQRPGYTVLLEFGSTVYLNNSGSLVEASYDTEPFRHMFKKDQDMFILHNVIAEEKKKWEGNYEGFFAKIAKWNWKFNTDGSYDITVSLVGMGDVIDSLKINVAIDKKSADAINITPPPNQQQAITVVTTAKLSRLNFALYEIYKSIQGKGTQKSNNSSRFIDYWSIPVRNFISYVKNQDGYVENINPPTQFDSRYGGLSIYHVTHTQPVSYSPQTYITFGTLLALITSTLSISSQNGAKTIPYFLFDFNFDDLSKDDNYIATFPGNFSSNPNVCLIPYEPIAPDISTAIQLPQTTVNTELQKVNFFSVDGNPLIGRMAYIYLDINFIAETFKSSLNENNEVILIEFLKNILNEVNNSLGGINNFRVIHNKDTNLLEIRSEVPLNVISPPELHTINTFGVIKGEGSFVREMDLNSELTDKFATQISAGAQADGNISQTNSTSFSIYNKGLVDRIIKETVDTTKPNQPSPVDPFFELFTEDVIECFKTVYDRYQFLDENISVLQNINSEFCKSATGALTQKSKSPAPFFLPFNLGLTMDGLSGMKIFQSFKVDGKALPLTYNSDDIQLIIKSLSHDVSPNGWLTKVETLAGPIIPPITFLRPGQYGELSPSIPFTSFGTASITNTSSLAPSTASTLNTPNRRSAMEKSYKTVFTNKAQEPSLCGQFSYLLAEGYVKNLGLNRKPLSLLNRHANSQNFSKSLLAIGYTQTDYFQSLSKNSLRDTINKTSWNYGDIAVYWSPIPTPGNKDNNHEKYGHAQIYIRDITGITSIAPNKNDSGWATSNSNNYGSSFIYNSKTNNNWNLVIYRAPSFPSKSIGTPSPI